MHSACLPDGKVVTARSYDPTIHGSRIACIDSLCHAPVFFIPGTADVSPHFKTSGKGESIHKESCGFSRKLSFEETVAKVSQYQSTLQSQGVREFVVRLNLNAIDPDYEARTVERNPSDKEKSSDELESPALKEESETPKTISSLRAVKKLFTTVEPDLLASIIVSVKGTKIPISALIQSCSNAHAALWKDTTLDMPYFIHGKIEKVIRRDKVWFINYESMPEGFFSLVVFDRYFTHFTLKDHELVGRTVLAYGYLKKNTFTPNRQSTEMIVKANKYIEFL